MRSGHRFSSSCLCVIAFLSLASAQAPKNPKRPTQPQKTQPQNEIPSSTGKPTFHAESRLVVVDVVVTRHGLPVMGLSKSDFSLLEDGKRQNILIFEPHSLAEATAQIPPPSAPHQYSNVSIQTPSSINIVLFDILNTPLLDQPYARAQMLQFLKTLPPGQPVALFELTTQLRMIAGFGSSSEELIAEASRILPHHSELLDSPEERQEAEEQIAELQRGSPSLNFFDRMQDLMDQMTGRRDVQRAKTTLEAFGQLASAVSGYRGRKNVLWLAEEFPLYFGPNLNPSGRDSPSPGNSTVPVVADLPDLALVTYADIERETASRLSAAEISLYPIDVRGLSVGGLVDARSRSSTGIGQIQSIERLHAEMEELARQTGGQAFYNTNDLKRAMRLSVENGATYYTLAYVPAEQHWDSRYHHIKVRMARPGLDAVYRKGYFAAPERRPSDQEADQALLSALQPATPESTMIRLNAQVVPPDAQNPKVRIRYVVDGSSVAFTDSPAAGKNGKLELVTVVWNRDLKAVANSSHTMEVSVSPDKYDWVVHNGLAVRESLQLPPGFYNLCIGVMDDGSRRIGTLNVPLHVGDLQKTAAK